MAVLFAGGEFDAFEVLGDIGGGEFEFDTGTAAAFDSDYARGAMTMRKCLAMRAEFTPALEGWLHFNVYHDDTTGASNTADNFLFRLIDTANNQSPFVFNGDSGAWQCERNTTGSTFVDFAVVNSSTEFVSDTLHTFDFHWKIDAIDGIYELFIDGVSVARFDGDTETQASTTVDAIQFTAGNGNNEVIFARFSEVIVTDVAIAPALTTIGWKLATLGPTADSAVNNEWTNGATEVDDIGEPTDLTLAHVGIKDKNQGFVMDDISAGASADNNVIKAVVVSARAIVGVGTVKKLRAQTRIGGADFTSGDLTDTRNTHLRYLQHVFDQDPDASDVWTEAVVNAAEFGLRSRA